MVKSAKKMYECPAMQVVVVKTEGIVCQSPDSLEGNRSGYEGFEIA